jgi:superfamily II RNA helicase
MSSARSLTRLACQYAEVDRRSDIRAHQESLRRLLSDDSLLLLPDFRARLAVLRRLQYIDEHSVLRKGRVACEVRQSGDKRNIERE